MSNCAVGLEASCHVLFILAFAGFVAFDWYHRDNEDRPQPARDDWATVLARFVCRRPLGLAALVTAYAGYISLAAFVDVDCGQSRSLHLVTALEQYARQDELSSFSLDNWESAQEASLNLGLCGAQRRLGAEPHRSLAAVGVTESLKIIYAARPRPGNVITAKSLLDARTTELRVTSNEYFDDHCYIAGGPDGKDRRCSNAAMRSWTESYFQSNGNVVDDVDAAALEFAKTPEGRYFFDVYFNVLHPQSNVSVSEIFFSITDRDMFRKWAKEYVLPTLESASTKDTRVCWLNGDLNDIEVEEAVTHDSLLAVGSLIFVALCMVIHTRSPSVAAVAMAQVLVSVPIGVYLHRVLNFLGLFIIAGIGADDSFLLFDVWKAEVDRGPSRTLPEILTASYRAAGASMAVTSISSAASFFTNAYSTLPALRSFGVFVGTLILVNFAFVMLVFPAALVLRARWRPPTPASVGVDEPSVCVAQSVELTARSAEPGSNPLQAAAEAQPAEEEARPLWGRVSLIVATPAELGEAFERFKSWAAVDQFFGASLPRAVKRHHRPILAVAFGLAVMGFASTAATLEADDEPPRFFRRSHNLGLVHDLAEYFAAEADRGGLSSAGGDVSVDVEAPMLAPTSRPIPAPTTKVTNTDPTLRPTPRPTAFPHPSPSHAPTMTRAPAGTTKPTIAPTTVAPTRAPVPLPTKAPVGPQPTVAPTTCTDDFFCSGAGECNDDGGGVNRCECYAGFLGTRCETEDSKTLDPGVMVSLDLVHGLKQRPGRPTARFRSGRPRYRRAFDLADPDVQVYVRDSCLNAVGKSKLKANTAHSVCLLDIFETKFLAPKGLGLPVEPRDKFVELFADFRQSNVLLDGSRVEEWIGIDCATNEATWIRDHIVLTVRRDSSVDDRLDTFREWRDYLDERADGRPAGVGRALLASSQEVMASLEANIVENSLIAATLSVCSCFFCVLALTRAVAHTGLILACVVWINALLASLITWMLGWKIGIIEAISFTIFVGVSVDYALHVDRAFRYACAGEMIRGGRLQQLRRALGEVGAPVAAAAATTFGAAIFLLFCIIQPFYKLGALICAHTFLSAVAALVVLPAVLVVMPDRSVSPAPVDDSEATAVDVPTTEAFEVPGLGPAATDAGEGDTARASRDDVKGPGHEPGEDLL